MDDKIKRALKRIKKVFKKPKKGFTEKEINQITEELKLRPCSPLD